MQNSLISENNITNLISQDLVLELIDCQFEARRDYSKQIWSLLLLNEWIKSNPLPFM